MKKVMLTICLLVGIVLVQDAKADDFDLFFQKLAENQKTKQTHNNYLMGIYYPKATETATIQYSGVNVSGAAETKGFGLEYGGTFDAGSLNLLLGLGVGYIRCDASIAYNLKPYAGYISESMSFVDTYGKLGVETPLENLYITGKFGGLFYNAREGYEKKLKVESHYGYGLLYYLPGDSHGIVLAVDNDNLLDWSYGLGIYWRF